MKAYDKPYTKTPNIDYLAANGTTYSNAYCNNPVCGPSRASMMTGRLSSEVGTFDNAAEFASEEPTFAHYMRSLGYQTTLIGKMHFIGSDQLHGFERRLTTDVYPSDYAWTADWTQVDEPYSPSRMNLLGVVESGLCQRSLQIDYDEHVYATAKQELYDIVRSSDDRPFLTFVSFTHPHNPFVTTQEYWDRYSDDEIPDPETPYIPYEERDPWAQRYYLTIRQDEFDVTDEQLKSARRAYFAMVSYVDDLIGGLLDTLRATDQLDNTVVIFTSDHGEMLGERGMWYKFNPYEHSVRVPMLAMGPGFKAGHREATNVSLADLMPTFTDIASEGTFDDFLTPIEGRSMLRIPEGGEDQRDIHIEFTGEGVHAPALILIRGNMKVVHCKTDPPMLFNLKDDPLEHKNLATDPGHADVLAEMLRAVHERWDEDDIERRALASQKKRLFVQEALKAGNSRNGISSPSRMPQRPMCAARLTPARR